MQEDMSEQNTTLNSQPTGNAFHTYLLQHKLSWDTVARAADVPSLTVWSIDHGLAILPSHAMQVSRGLYTLTGIPYHGPIKTITLSDTSSHNQTK